MALTWLLLVVISVLTGIAVTLLAQFYFFRKYFYQQEPVIPQKKCTEHFILPKVLLETYKCEQRDTKESCLALNLLLQFLFHELRDTQKVRKWFRNKLALELEELLARSTIGRVLSSIKIRDISLGSEFPIINNVVIQNVKVNKDYSHIDTLDLKLDLRYCGGFQLVVDANMLLGKTAFLSIKVIELVGEGRLQFTRLPYSHWSFTFYNEPKLQLQVESQFQGRPLPQITTLIANQIRKSLKKKHTLPNFKLRYKPFFTATEDAVNASNIPFGDVQLIIHQISRLNDSVVSQDREVYCLAALDSVPWIEIVNYKGVSFYVLDLIITKEVSEHLGFELKQQYIEEKSQPCVVLESVTPGSPASKGEACPGDIIISVDGKRVSTLNQAPKLIKCAAFQFTLRVERRIQARLVEEFAIQEDILSNPYFTTLSGLRRRRKGSESDSNGSTPSPSLPGSPSKRGSSPNNSPDHVKLRQNVSKQTGLIGDGDSPCVKLIKTKCFLNNQIIIFDCSFVMSVGINDRYLNVSVRAKENEIGKDIILGYINMPLNKLLHSNDSLKSFQLKPPDSFSANYSRDRMLSRQNGFIPPLCYGDILMSVTYQPSSSETFNLTSSASKLDVNAGSSAEATPIPSPRPAMEEKSHDFMRTHLPNSMQCQFCGKKIWLKEAEKCRECGMTCHKKCVAKCKAGTICSPFRPGSNAAAFISTSAAIINLADVEGRASNNEETNDANRRLSVQPEIIMTTADDSPQPTPTKKGLGGLLASVASASRGLKRVGSANNLALPGSQSPSHQSKSLPPSPQQTPAPSRKPSLPLELSEDITSLLQTLLQHGSDQGDMMDLAKERGKTLYEELDLSERKEKIHEMINKLESAIDSESEIRFSLAREEQTSKDPTKKTKTAFLIGKSDEKNQAMAILMLHFCAGLQHIQDLEEQEREVLMATDLETKE